MSPTSRSSRCASSSTVSSDACRSSRILDDALEQRRDVAADRRQRCAQLVRDRHQEVALHLLDLGEPLRHLAEPLAAVAELARRVLRHRDGVVAARDLVGRVGELQHRPHDAAREVARRAAPATSEAEQAGEREPLEQRVDAVAHVGLRRRDDDRADRVVSARFVRKIGLATAR